MNYNSKIFVAGHNGLVGSAIYCNLIEKGYKNLLIRNSNELDLTCQKKVEIFFNLEKPEYVFLAAAKVGGIIANNSFRGEFIYKNLMIQNNVIHSSYLNNAKKLLFLGSTCVYPRETNQPIKESDLLSSNLEYTNEPYAIAKIAGLKLCESYNLQYGTNFISAMPTNLFGPKDNFDLQKSHVLPALIRKIILGNFLDNSQFDLIRKDIGKYPINDLTEKSSDNEIVRVLKSHGIEKNQIEIWGTGKPRREFLWSEDLAEACVFLLENINFSDTYNKDSKEIRNTHINIGTGEDISIRELAEKVRKFLNYKGKFIFNSSKPDGTMRKLSDVKKIHSLGWKHKTSLDDGIKIICRDYLLY